MLLFAKPDDHPRIKQALSSLLHVPFRFETMGSHMILYQPGELLERDYPEGFHTQSRTEQADPYQVEHPRPIGS